MALSQPLSETLPEPGYENLSRLSALARAFEVDRGFIAISAIYSATVFAFTWFNGKQSSIIFDHYLGITRVAAVTFSVYLLAFTALSSLVSARRAGRPLTLARDLCRAAARILFGVVPVLVVVTVFMTAFTAYKNQITDVVPFYLDEELATLDRLLHLGRHPWEWLHPILGTASATGFIELVYATTWGLVTFGMLYWQALGRGPERDQYLMTFALCWIVIGTVLATIMSSAGPPYYAHVAATENPYGPLFEYLREVSGETGFSAIRYQDYLWAIHAKDVTASYTGISAMPSMHVSMATLAALAAWRINRLLGWIAIAHVALIQIGSVHLGWHYATDGYLAIFVTILIWHWVGRATVGTAAR